MTLPPENGLSTHLKHKIENMNDKSLIMNFQQFEIHYLQSYLR